MGSASRPGWPTTPRRWPSGAGAADRLPRSRAGGPACLECSCAAPGDHVDAGAGGGLLAAELEAALHERVADERPAHERVELEIGQRFEEDAAAVLDRKPGSGDVAAKCIQPVDAAMAGRHVVQAERFQVLQHAHLYGDA